MLLFNELQTTNGKVVIFMSVLRSENEQNSQV